MYKLMIVDDDEVICRGLSACTDWESMGITVSGIAFNAMHALEQIRAQPVDICITDICMPVIDGLEFACILREEFPDTKIILLSAFSEFEYAQKAVRIGVFEYLTKPFSKSDVSQTISSVVAQLDTERKQLSQLSYSTPMINELLLRQVLHGQTLSEKHVCDAVKAVGLDMDTRWYRVVFLTISPYSAVQEETDNLRVVMQDKQRQDRIREALSDFDRTTWFTTSPLGGVELVVQVENEKERAGTEAVLQRCVETLGALGNCLFHLGVSPAVRGAAGLPNAQHMAQKAAAYGMDGTQETIVYAEDLAEMEDQLELAIAKETISAHISQYRFSELCQELYRLFSHMQLHKYALYKIQSTAIELLLTILRTIGEDRLYNSTVPDFQEVMQKILLAQEAEVVHSSLQMYISRLYQIFENYHVSTSETLIDKLCRYIDEHYSESELSLKQVADHAYISTSYLSYLFKKHLSSSFSSYLTKVRMGNAMRILLSTDARTYEVSEMVGYNSAQYFNICFKKYTGQTPGEYRLAHR